LLRALSYWRPYKGQAAFIIISLSFQEFFDAYYALSMKAIIDMFLSGDSSTFGWIVFGLAVGFVISATSGMLSEYLIARASSLLLNDIRSQIFEHLQALSMDFYMRSKAGDISSRFVADVTVIEQLLTDRLMDALVAVLSLLINIPILL
jgi:ATP-binding cassette, subfamily B, bacterial